MFLAASKVVDSSGAHAPLLSLRHYISAQKPYRNISIIFIKIVLTLKGLAINLTVTDEKQIYFSAIVLSLFPQPLSCSKAEDA